MSDAGAAEKPLGFWSCWALVVGTMVGSGIFMMPTVLAPYGLPGLGGLVLAAIGAMALALVFARAAAQTSKSGGPYNYAREAFGDLTGFVTGWAYWCCYWTGLPVVAIAFVGYLIVLMPGLGENTTAQALTALGLIWAVTLVNVRGLRDASIVQIVMTVLKIVPLLAIVAVAFVVGDVANLPSAAAPATTPLVAALATTALLTLWAFTGFETTTLPAGAIRDCRRTIPRALIVGMSGVALLYLAATWAVMLLVPHTMLVNSTAPFAEAARALGAWGPPLIAGGALIATAGTLNGMVFVCGQMPMAIAQDGLAPAPLGAVNRGGAPYLALIVSAMLASILLLLNYSRGLVGAFTFMLMISTMTTLLPYFVVAVAELKRSWRSAFGWALIASIGAVYTLFALWGSGAEVIGWGLLLAALGVPLFYLSRPRPALNPAA